MNTFAIYLCFGLIALSAGQSLFRPGSVSAGSSASSSPSIGQVNLNGGVASSRFVGSAPVVSSSGQSSSSAQEGSFSNQGSASAGSAGQGSFQAFAPASQVNFNQAGISAGVGVASSQGFGVGSSSAQGQAASQAGAQQQVIISKDFYIHSAPEEPEEVISTRQAASGPARKNYRVVFIKTPSPKFTVSTAALSGALNEEKTAIYVLAKHPDLNVIQQQVAQSAQKASKPEVFFIKYQTPEEAQLAQQEIQAQYDALGGETSVSDEGVAPVHSVIGRAGGASAGGAVGVNAGAAAGVNAGAAAGVNAGAAAGANAGAAAGVGSGFSSGVGSGFSSGAGFGAASSSGFGLGSGSASQGSARPGAVSGVGSVSGTNSGSFGGVVGTFADGAFNVNRN